MSRYVDAEWLIKESMPLSFSVQKWVNEVQIMTAPSIDIVFCEECEWCFYVKSNDLYVCIKKGIDHKICDPKKHFCSYGERRSNEI